MSSLHLLASNQTPLVYIKQDRQELISPRISMATSSQRWLEGRMGGRQRRVRENMKKKKLEEEEDKKEECAFMSPQHPRQINKPGEV